MFNSSNKIFEKLRVIAMVMLATSAIAFFWSVFRQIDRQLQSFNYTVLKVVNDHKSKMVKREFLDLERLINKLHHSFENDQLDFVSMQLERESISSVMSSVTYWIGSNSKAYNWGIPTFTQPKIAKDTLRYLSSSYPTLEIYKTTDQGIALYSIDLMKLHQYFESNNEDGRTYSELYDQAGNCLMHPDTSYIGKVNVEVLKTVGGKTDTIINSDFLELPVVRNTYLMQGMFANTTLFVSIPLDITEVEVKGIVDFSLLLSISGIVLMAIFLIVINMQRRKTDQLSMNNLAYQKEDAMLRFENLKRKIDPHFLFNALGSLQLLIGKDGKQAQTFVGKLARVYRKFLSTNDTGLNTMREELLLSEEYYYLQKIRFGEALLTVDFSVPSEVMTKQIPRFSLQILIENAIKHNEISAENPLSISLAIEDNCLCVQNKFLPRRNKTDSTGYGTNLIANVYDYYQVKGFEYGVTADFYEVKLPLI